MPDEGKNFGGSLILDLTSCGNALQVWGGGGVDEVGGWSSAYHFY